MMTISSHELLDTSIGQLRTLVHFLADQLGDGGQPAEAAEPETRACREILHFLEGLIGGRRCAGGPPGAAPVHGAADLIMESLRKLR